MSATWAIDTEGVTTLTRRGETQADGNFGFIRLLHDARSPEVEIEAEYDDNDCIRLRLLVYEVEGLDGEVYHLAQSVNLNRKHTAQLRDFLSFLLAQSETA